MPPKQKPSKRSAGKQVSLATSGILPMLAKTSMAIGLYCIVPGPFWDYCPPADKDKKYKCVTEFLPIHDFAGGRKGAAYKCKEMGENGEGSLEAGATSGEDFVIRYASTIEIDDFVDKDGIINEFAPCCTSCAILSCCTALSSR